MSIETNHFLESGATYSNVYSSYLCNLCNVTVILSVIK